jgi:hypothetical protein
MAGFDEILVNFVISSRIFQNFMNLESFLEIWVFFTQTNC